MQKPGALRYGLLVAACLAQFSTLRAQTAPTADALMQAGQSAIAAGDRYSALRNFAQALKADANDAQAAQAVANILVDLGGSYGAASALGSAGDIGLRAKEAASLVRWGTQIVPPDPRERFATTDAAIRALEALIVESRALAPPDPGLTTRLAQDLAVALRDRKRWTDVLRVVNSLRAAGNTLPSYVRQAEADALLGLRQPHEARSVYAQVLAADPDNQAAVAGRFYAEVEDEDFGAAFASADQLLAASEPSRRFGIARSIEPNPDWLDAQVRAGLVRSYAEMPDAAWERLVPLAEAAPALAYLRSALGGVAAQRGWPRRAQQEIDIAASLAPDDLGVALAQVDSDLRRRQWNRAELRLAMLGARHLADEAIQRTQRDLGQYRAPELRITTALDTEEGSSPYSLGDGISLGLNFYSSPLSERWRMAAAASYTSATLPEGKYSRERLGLGMEGRWPDITLEALAWQNGSVLAGPGFSLGLQWAPDDHWTLGAAAERFAADTPLRALVYGITANMASASAGYAWTESQSAGASVRVFDFSDGNHRQEAFASAALRVLSRPGLQLTLRGSLYASNNSLAGAPYYNPSSDFAADLTAEVNHQLWRFYERGLKQRLFVTAGVYNQASYARGATGAVRYEHEYQHDPFTAFRYGLGWSQRLYDGVPEHMARVYLTLEHRFQ
ncbi:MAG: poly-beta-1,6 N-acetyl-D-glucosamine export porin PgaA [Rhodoferax sp.]